jgi:nucleoside-diphosphate-sugar epimerase
MKVAVFGAAGWTGRAILASLAQRHEVRAIDWAPTAWDQWQDVDGPWTGECHFGDIADFATVDRALAGVDAVIHAAVYAARAPGGYGVDDELPFRINLKGLWNVLEAARQRQLPGPVVHLGSCQTVHPQGLFFSAEVRRPDASLYAVTKRLQEEMCRQYHEGTGLRVIVLRPDYIVDSRLGIGRHREPLGPGGSPCRNGWVCRHDLAEACRLAVESSLDFDVFHVVGTPEADASCNVARSREVLGLQYRGNLEQYR